MRSRLGAKVQDDSDFGFNMDGAESYTGFSFTGHSSGPPFAPPSVPGGGGTSDLDIPVEIPTSALTSEAVEALDAPSGPTSSY